MVIALSFAAVGFAAQVGHVDDDAFDDYTEVADLDTVSSDTTGGTVSSVVNVPMTDAQDEFTADALEGTDDVNNVDQVMAAIEVDITHTPGQDLVIQLPAIEGANYAWLKNKNTNKFDPFEINADNKITIPADQVGNYFTANKIFITKSSKVDEGGGGGGCSLGFAPMALLLGLPLFFLRK